MSKYDQYEYETSGDSRNEVGLEFPFRGRDSVTGSMTRASVCLDRLLDGVTDSNRHEEVDAGPPTGREV